MTVMAARGRIANGNGLTDCARSRMCVGLTVSTKKVAGDLLSRSCDAESFLEVLLLRNLANV